MLTIAGRSGLAVTCLTAVWEDQGSNPTVDSCMLIVNITTIYSLGHGLHTLTAVPRSTQPSTLRGTIKWVSAFVLSNNKWRRWVWLLAAYRRTHSPGRLAWSVGRRPLGAVPYSWTGWTLAVALSYDDSTINIVVIIISAQWTKWMAEIMRSFDVRLFVCLSVCAQRPVNGSWNLTHLFPGTVRT